MFGKFVFYYVPHMRLFLADMACAFAVAVCNLFYPMITRRIINVYVPDRDMASLVVWVAVLFCIYLLKAALSYFIQYYGHMMGVRMQVDMRKDAFLHIQRLPFSYFDRMRTGVIMSRVINDTFEIAELAHHGPEDLFISIVTLVGSFLLLCSMSLTLTFVIFSFVPLLFLFAFFKRRKLGRTSMRTRKQIGEVNADLQSSIAGVRVAKAFETVDRELEKFQVGNRLYQEARSDQYQAMAEFFSGTALILDMLLLITLCAGGVFVYNGRIDVGDYAAYLLFAGLFTEPIKKLVNFTEQLQTGMTGFVRLQELMAAPPEEDQPGSIELREVAGAVRFDHVSFRYDDGKRVLRDIDLAIAPGRTLAVVGPSGGGKSTLCHLLPRFYEIDGGSISIDGVDIRRYTRVSLRQRIGIVQQDTHVFAGTIRENIAYGDFAADEERIRAAARDADIESFIDSLPDGLDTYVGERGVTLSGGQRQRIAIARVFLKNPRILILDEATSALDNVTEMRIQEALDHLSSGRTTLVVAHRLSTIRNADRIAVLTTNGVEESGSHAELLALGGIYAKLWRLQERSSPDGGGVV